MVECLKALSDETRFKIINLLLQKSYCVCALSNLLNISQAAVSQHLNILKNCNLVYKEKISYYVHYKINVAKFKKISKFLHNMVENYCEKNIPICTGDKKEN